MTDNAVAAAPGVIERDAPQYNARLVRREDENDSLAYFWVRFDGEPTPFEAGQYMTIGVMVDGQHRPAPYSVASPPAVAGTDGYEFYVRLVQGGTFTPLLWRPAGRARDADDRPEGQVHAPAGRRPDAHLHLVGDRQRPVRGDDAPAPRRRAPAARSSSSTASRTRDELGYRRLLEDWESSGAYPVTYVPPSRGRTIRATRAGWVAPGRVETILGRVLDELGLTAGRTRSPTSAATRT